MTDDGTEQNNELRVRIAYVSQYLMNDLANIYQCKSNIPQKTQSPGHTVSSLQQ